MNSPIPPQTPRPFWQRGWFLSLLLMLATLLAYQPAWHGAPVFDDEDHLTPPELTGTDGLVRIWTELGVVSQYYPVTHTAFWLQHQLWGDTMLGYHLVNILLHVTAALLLARVLLELRVPGAWLIAAIFALHPVHAESVAWISELKNTLSAVFYFGAALAYLRFDRARQTAPYVLALTLFVLGLLSKSVIATLPAALLVIFWWQRGKLSWSRDVRPLLPFFALGIASGLFTAWVERHYIGAQGEAFALTLLERGLVAGRALWFYLSKLLWPAELIFIYPRWEISAAAWWQYLFPVAALALLVVAIAWVRRGRGRGPLAALLFFAGTLFPALGFLNVYPFRYSFVADHYQYLASIGLITAAVTGGLLLGRRWAGWSGAAGRVAALAVLALLATLTWRQSRMYTDVETLWRTTLARNPVSFVAHSNLANHLLQLGRVDEALHHIDTALTLEPEAAEVHNNFGNVLQQQGNLDAALASYRRAIELRPGLAVAHYNAGTVLQLRGEMDAALTHLERAVELQPDYILARLSLANLALERGRPDEAAQYLERVLALRPDDATANGLYGATLYQLGRPEESIVHTERAVTLAPENPDLHNNLGGALLALGRVDDAIARFQETLRLRPDFAAAQVNLANAYLAKGRRNDALLQFQAIIESRPDDAAVHNDYANALLQMGRAQDAMKHLRRALELQPDFTQAHHNLGYVLLQREQVDEAISHFQKALALNPALVASRYQLANALLRRGDRAGAIREFQEILAVQPGSVHVLNDLGVAFVQQGEEDAAMAHFQMALETDANSPEAHNNLGKLLLHKGHIPEGVAHLRASLKLQPDDPDTLLNLAWVLATSADASVRNGLEAIILAQRANQASGGHNPFVLRTLAAAFAEAGRYVEAITTARRALELAAAPDDLALIGELRTQLELYQQEQPFREGAEVH